LWLAPPPAPSRTRWQAWNATSSPWENTDWTMISGPSAGCCTRTPPVFPLLLTRPAVTPAARAARDAVQAALREGGLPHLEAARAERLISTAVLGFAASEAAGRFRHHDQSVIDEDFAELLRWLRRVLPAPGDVL
jgi:hypothetical protein